MKPDPSLRTRQASPSRGMMMVREMMKDDFFLPVGDPVRVRLLLPQIGSQ